jgi:hypothetical protein
MTIVKKSDLSIISEDQLRSEYKNVSFPQFLTNDALEGTDYEIVDEGDLPVISKYQSIEKVAYLDKGKIKLQFNVVTNQPSIEDLLKDYEQAIDSLLNQKANEYKYDSVYTMISYRGDPNPKFAQEAESMFQWRSAVWTKANELLEAYVQTSTQNPSTPIPSINDIVSQLPEFTLV